MTLLRIFLTTAVIGWIVPPAIHAQAPLPPFDLALTINDGASNSVYRGWPLLLRGDAVLMADVVEPFPLELGSLTLALAPTQGPATRWPLRRVTEFATAPTLGGENESVQVVWVLTPEQATTLAPGDYTARLSWAGRTSPPVAFSVREVPTALSPEDEIRRARLESQLWLHLGNTAEAMAALVPAEARQPESISLLVQRARVHVRRGEYREALQVARRARAIFARDYPDTEHPPRSIVEVETKARTELFKEITPGPPLPELPDGASSAVSFPTGQVPADLTALLAGPKGPKKPTAVPPTNVAPAGTSTAPPPTPAPTPTQPGTPTVGAIVPGNELVDAKIIADTAGQWAFAATASSQYGTSGYSAARAVGVPNIPLGMAGDNSDAWCPAAKNEGTAWLELAFATPVHASEVRVRQNNAPGAMAKIELLEADGTSHLAWEGTDPAGAPVVREITWFAIRVPKTAYLVAKVKLTLNLAAVPGWKQIDAVQLVGTTD